jgi:hypothetical protein
MTLLLGSFDFLLAYLGVEAALWVLCVASIAWLSFHLYTDVLVDAGMGEALANYFVLARRLEQMPRRRTRIAAPAVSLETASSPAA